VRRIAVGYDGAPESRAALALAAALAVRAGAELRVVGVIDDRVPSFPWSLQLRQTVDVWDELLEGDRVELESDARAATAWLEPAVEVSAVCGSPATVLQQLSDTTDLLVIGSRRWGIFARVLLGSTGEALLHGARCPVLVAARPAER
jgi:nucleotide-binding universal stress UspA family protein